jgi:hypothetical protein
VTLPVERQWAMASGVADSGNRPPTLVQGLSHDPHHASLLRRHLQTDVDKLTAKLIRRATAQARWDGGVTGSSFYFGMPPAIASLYCRQVMTVLQIAALHGYDPKR